MKMGLFSSLRRPARNKQVDQDPAVGTAASVKSQPQQPPSPEDAVKFADFEAYIRTVGLEADWNGAQLKHLFGVFDIDGNGWIERSEFEKSLGRLRTLIGALDDPKPVEEHHEAPLPPGLAEWEPIAKTEAVKKASAGIKALEAAFLLAPTGEAAEELRAKTEALAATLRQVIDERVREDQIVKRSDRAIAAGAESFTAIYDSVTDLIKSTQAEGMATLGKELSDERLKERVGLGGAECLQLSKILMVVYEHAAAARPLATALVARIAAVCGITQPAEPTPLKSTVRILEKALLRPGAARGDCERVCDIVRNMIVAESAEQLAKLVRAFLDDNGIVVVRVKDRFKNPSGGGWRDIMVRAPPQPSHRWKPHFRADELTRRRASRHRRRSTTTW